MPLRASAKLGLVGANLVGSIVYLIAVSPSWAIPIERENGIHSVTGEPFIWAVAGWPILALFFVVNLSWVVFAVLRRSRQDIIVWLAAPLIWLTALWIDFVHH